MKRNMNGKTGDGRKRDPASSGKNTTEIVCILDRSGSMQAIRSDAIGAFNRFRTSRHRRTRPG